MPKNTSLLIGCPVLRREWIIRPYLEHAAASAYKAGVNFAFVFVAPENDPTMEIINDFCTEAGVVAWWKVIEDARPFDRRDWSHERYHRMVEIRNILLSEVRNMMPDYFLSLDSDILVHPDLISNLIETQIRTEVAAVGGKTYMTSSGTDFPSYARLGRTGSLMRSEATGVISVDVIMAIKLMTPLAYGIDYEFEDHGEDIGWSKALTAVDGTLKFDGRVASKHILDAVALDRFDKRCGF